MIVLSQYHLAKAQMPERVARRLREVDVADLPGCEGCGMGFHPGTAADLEGLALPVGTPVRRHQPDCPVITSEPGHDD